MGFPDIQFRRHCRSPLPLYLVRLAAGAIARGMARFSSPEVLVLKTLRGVAIVGSFGVAIVIGCGDDSKDVMHEHDAQPSPVDPVEERFPAGTSMRRRRIVIGAAKRTTSEHWHDGHRQRERHQDGDAQAQ